MEEDDWEFDITEASTNIINVSSITDPEDIYINTDTFTAHVYGSNEEWISFNDVSLTSIEFEDTMPNVAKIEDMCNDYPGLRKAYENFKSVYKMVEQDWIGKQKERDD